MYRRLHRFAIVAVMAISVVVLSGNTASIASSNVPAAFAKVVSVCRPTRNTVEAVIATNTVHQPDYLVFTFSTKVPGTKFGNEGTFYGWGNDGEYSSIIDPTRLINNGGKNLPVPAGPITIFWSSFYMGFGQVEMGQFAHVKVSGCPLTVTSALSPMATVAISSTAVSTVLTGRFAPKRITERLLDNNLLSITAHGTFGNNMYGNVPVIWQISRPAIGKPWSGKLTVSLPALGGRGVFNHNISVNWAKSGQITGRVTRQVMLSGKKQTEVANWSVDSIVTA